MAETAEFQFANLLTNVLAELPYESREMDDLDELDDSLFHLSEQMKYFKLDYGFGELDGDVPPYIVGAIFENENRYIPWVLDLAKRAVESDYDIVRNFGDRDKRYFLDSVANARLRQLQKGADYDEIRLAYNDVPRRDSPEKIELVAQIKAFQWKLRRRATVPSPDVSTA